MNRSPGIEGIDRRLVLRRLAQAGLILGGAGVLAALGLRSRGRWSGRGAPETISRRDVAADPARPGAVIAAGGAIAPMVRAAIDALGGIGRFVAAGDVVLVKPNMAWDRPPEMGANTHPAVVAEVVRLCRAAGATRVLVGDVAVHDTARVAVRSGIAEAAREAGAELVLPDDAGFREAALGGSVLSTWEVFRPALSATKLINVPVVKDHALSRLTAGLKNWYGVLGGTRARLHQDIDTSIADLAVAFRPTLTVVDATRVMTRGGPTGGRLEDVRPVGLVAAGTDPVALDAWGARLLNLDPRSIGYLALAEGRGVGSIAAGDALETVRAGA
ncbi:MAG: DUF362 domain-containing protein [Acidobacteria bacterium]|nr:DUF362 domain-containing protein [Acidobacteriota bacterium]